MKMNQKIVKILLFIICITLLATYGFVYYRKHDKSLLTEESAYLFNTKNFELVRTNHFVDYTKSEEEIVKDLYKVLSTGTDDVSLIPVVPSDIKLLKYNLYDDGVLYLNFDSNFNNMTAMENSILKSSLVWSMTSLNFVNGVVFEVDSEPILNNTADAEYIFDRSNMVINPKFTASRVVDKSLVLYFPKDDNSGMLYTEIRDTISNEEYSEERIVMEELLKGTTLENAKNALPNGTKLRDITTNDGICQVDLSENFVNNNSKNPAEQIASVYAIVNSLTEIKSVEKVQFLIESKKTNPFNGVDISQPLAKETKYVE